MNTLLGRDDRDATTTYALDYLVRAGYLEEGLPRRDDRFGPTTVRPTEKALQVVAGWPAGSGDALLSSLIAELERRIATAGTPEERTKLERFRDFAVGVGRDVLVSVLSAYADRTVHGSSRASEP